MGPRTANALANWSLSSVTCLFKLVLTKKVEVRNSGKSSIGYIDLPSIINHRDMLRQDLLVCLWVIKIWYNAQHRLKLGTALKPSRSVNFVAAG